VDVVSERRMYSSSHGTTIGTARSTSRLSHGSPVRTSVRPSVRSSGSPGGPYRKFWRRKRLSNPAVLVQRTRTTSREIPRNRFLRKGTLIVLNPGVA